jgi:hypothetical protein
VILQESHNGEHQMVVVFQNKIGVNIQVNLKKGILIFGESMKKNFGKITMPEYERMEEMANMKKPKNQKNNQNYMLM